MNVCTHLNTYGNLSAGDIVIFMNCSGNKVFLIATLFNVFIGLIFVKKNAFLKTIKYLISGCKNTVNWKQKQNIKEINRLLGEKIS